MATTATTEFFALTEAVTKDGRRSIRTRVPQYIGLDQKLAENLATLFDSMADSFFNSNPTVVDFDGRYTPDKGEVFVIRKFALDPAIEKAAKAPLTTEVLSLTKSPFPQIKAIIATQRNSPIRVVFQEFRTDQIIRQGFALVQKVLHGKQTFDRVDQSGIAIGNDIDAVFDKGDLYFRSYYTANRFADLTPYFKDASDEEIKDLFKLDGIVAEDEDALLEKTDTAMRRKFAIIKKTDILSLVTAKHIQATAAAQGLNIEIDPSHGKQRILIPADKAQAKEVLDFLCQARFMGALTNEVFVANSYRPLKSSSKPAVPKAKAKGKGKARSGTAKKKP
jgi:hypothetical protein